MVNVIIEVLIFQSVLVVFFSTIYITLFVCLVPGPLIFNFRWQLFAAAVIFYRRLIFLLRIVIGSFKLILPFKWRVIRISFTVLKTFLVRGVLGFFILCILCISYDLVVELRF